ncbi:hypothetical protein MMAG44476_34664 [Mycolicibacterium mageritense DSM 44476 = CIP 104973]|uniref:(S)-ureidoglycine aminohydrolase cupin domain-containing protein n=1 Tax=Mycolicibacterium mageritense TaxID=53462 RepID=A0AAI8U154_MYCME|nr:cupin domain-containing protein [Mycolicibacterium mageritense]OKH61203.1 transcriptional regulator [Mycobacterium sp. SWH-M3]MCC9187074.1 cupin domain-containing protein [Mycolicibacterium mageritense]TXI54272.1 MAG: DUF861 domain-containing protein [Mycolicibacterium mageritense]CDO27157.1 hypothetical protein BN978_07722 [Mycolicibacterium mageritense DSM 44476 = CIP 104973]BBX38108.1 hypothetical protein MMAGJ_73900 [Mycolicibacterium mageritense]
MSQTFWPAALFEENLEESLLGQPSAEVLGEEIRVRSSVPFISAEPGIRSGVWEASPGLSRWEFVDRGEVIHVLEGRMVITEDGGDPVTVEAGSAAFFPIGWKGTWEIQERIRKFFVVFAA